MQKMYYLHIANDFDSCVMLNNNIVINNDNVDKNTISLATNKEELYFSYTPYSNKNITYLPYAEKLKLSNINQANHIKIIPFRNNHFEIYFEKIEAPNIKPSNIIVEEYFGKLNIVVLNNSSGNILFYENNKLKKQLTCKLVTTAEITQIQNKIIVKCLLEKNNYYIAILNIDNLEILKEVVCDSYEENKNEIKCLTKLNDLAKHAKISSFNYQNGSEEEYNVYLNGSPTKTNSYLLIPYAFLEAIKVKNYNLARTYLCDNLSSVTNAHLNEYFGIIEEIYLDSYNIENFKIPYVIKNSNGFENVDFIVENNKILEIIK